MGYIGQTPTKVPLTSADITDGTIALADMAANSVDSPQYVDGSIDAVHLSANSVDSDSYVDLSIDTIHIGNDQITGAKLNPALVSGDIIYADGTDTINRLAKPGTPAGEVLTFATSASAPSWVAAGGGITDVKFLACLTSIASNVTGNGTAYSTAGKTFTEIYDTGSDFASGTFTAPETGKYILFGSFYMNGCSSAMTQQIIYIVTSNRTYNGFRGAGDAVQAPGQGNFLWSLVADMDASDTFHATIVFYGGTLTAEVEGHGDAQNDTFMGAMFLTTW